MSTEKSRPIQYRPEIDGLRALAVLPVILFHAGLPPFGGGFVGVDVFFTISGYLITSILIGDLSASNFSVARFYERRARRILPALYLVLGACVPLAWLVMVPSQLEDLSGSVLSVLLFSSNVLFWQRTDYFAPSADLNPLLHTWSLAVEEQYYVVFPILLWCLWRFGRRVVGASLVALSAGSLLLAAWAVHVVPTANFYLLPSRWWEIGIGACCAFWPADRGGDRVLSTLGLSLVVLSVFAFDGDSGFPSLWTLVPVGGAALVIRYAAAETPAGQILSSRPLVQIGLISYSAYLWHQPLFAFARLQDDVNAPSLLTMSLLSALSIALGWCSWRYAEQPFRGRFPATRAGVFAWSAAGAVPFAILGTLGVSTGGYEALWVNTHPAVADTLAVIDAAEEARAERLADGPCRFDVEALDAATAERIGRCAEEQGPGVLIVGDSHSIDVYNGLVLNRAYPGSFVVGISHAACRLQEPGLACGNLVEEFLRQHPGSVRRLIYTQAGFHLLRDSGGRVGRSIVSGVPMTEAIDADRFQFDRRAIGAISETLDRFARHTRVTWLGPRLEPQISPAYILKRGCDAHYDLRPGQRQLYANLDAAARGVGEGRPWDYVSQQDIVALDMARDYIDCTTWYFRDGDHWSLAGTRRFTQRLLDAGAL